MMGNRMMMVGAQHQKLKREYSNDRFVPADTFSGKNASNYSS